MENTPSQLRRRFLTSIRAVLALVALVALALHPAPSAAQLRGQTIYALTDTNTLLQINSSDPATVVAQQTISGLAANETLQGIDFRPRTGQLYAVSSASRLYTLNTATGAATAIGTQPLTTTLQGTAVGFDFNPSVDRIRIVTDARQNLRVNPGSGALVVDGTLAYAAADPNSAATPNIVASAYTNNISGTSAISTTLYNIDATLNALVTQNPPNAGTLNTVGALGADVTNVAGFDIGSSSDTAFAALNVANTTASGLYTISLSTGAATLVGPIGGGQVIRGLAVAPVSLVTVYGLTASNKLVSFSSSAPGTITQSVQISGLAAGETLQGIDFRPANGQLYALSSASRVYTLNTVTGAATVLGTRPLSPTLNGTAFGFDFNPVPDRIRVVSDADQNLRLVPTSGAVGVVDKTLVYTTTDVNAAQNPFIVAAGYTNNFTGTTTTSLYVIDANLNTLALQSPPNDGILTTVGALGVDVSDQVGFDISPRGAAYIAYSTTSATTSSFGAINLRTGRVVPLGAVGGGEIIRDIAIPTIFRYYHPLISRTP